jgi:hypothetical protein
VAPTHISLNGPTDILDMAVTNNYFSLLYPIVVEDFSSDHFPVLFHLNVIPELLSIPKPRKSNWKSYVEILDTKFAKLPLLQQSSEQLLDERVTVITTKTL